MDYVIEISGDDVVSDQPRTPPPPPRRDTVVMREKPSRKLRAMYSTVAEARRYVAEGYVYFALIQIQLVLVALHQLPAWSLPLVTPIWMARMMIGRHELIHLRKESNVDWFTRLWPVLAMVTPFSAGFAEYRALHADHHRYVLTGRDPDLYQIRGSKLSGWFYCFISPEQTLIHWWRTRGIDAALRRQIIARAVVFFALALIAGRHVLWYWAPLRLTYATALFFFSHLLHRRQGRYGVFRIELPTLGVAAFIALFGRAGWLAVCNHDIHHLNGNVSPLRMPEARRIIERERSTAR